MKNFKYSPNENQKFIAVRNNDPKFNEEVTIVMQVDGEDNYDYLVATRQGKMFFIFERQLYPKDAVTSE